MTYNVFGGTLISQSVMMKMTDLLTDDDTDCRW